MNLYDINGALHYAQAFELKKSRQKLELYDLPQNLMDGTYILQVLKGKEIILTEKIIKLSR